MKGTSKSTLYVMGGLGALLAAWVGVLVAPGRNEGLRGIVSALSYGMKHPFTFRKGINLITYTT